MRGMTTLPRMDTQSEIGPTGLHEAELEALAGLVRVMIGLDQDVSEEESDHVSLIALEVGKESFWRHMQAARGVNLDAALALAKKVERQEGRETVFSMLERLAASDGFDPAEADLLDKLREMWIG